MAIHRSINEPPRNSDAFSIRWQGPDQGLITCWERGREKAQEDAQLATRARAGELVPLAWKGGGDKPMKGIRYGTLNYLATWQGLRGEDLAIDPDEEISIVCSKTKTKVIFTRDITKFLNA